jgi:hypothetical protein
LDHLVGAAEQWQGDREASASAIEDYLNMEHRRLTLARSYEFAERLSRFTGRSGSADWPKR